jgi:hypothetical protein
MALKHSCTDSEHMNIKEGAMAKNKKVENKK